MGISLFFLSLSFLYSLFSQFHSLLLSTHVPLPFNVSLIVGLPTFSASFHFLRTSPPWPKRLQTPNAPLHLALGLSIKILRLDFGIGPNPHFFPPSSHWLNLGESSHSSYSPAYPLAQILATLVVFLEPLQTQTSNTPVRHHERAHCRYYWGCCWVAK